MLLLLAFFACDPAPEPCLAMCERVVAQECGCLAQWDAQWSELGYSDQEDYFEACETWVWQMRLLEEDAGSDALDGHCQDWTETLDAGPMECGQWAESDWSDIPWR